MASSFILNNLKQSLIEQVNNKCCGGGGGGVFFLPLSHRAEETKQVLRLSLTEFSLPKFYLLFGISKVKSAAVIAFRSSYRDRSFSPGSYERETFALSSLETVTEALLEIMEVLDHD